MKLAWDAQTKRKKIEDREAGRYVREQSCPYYNTARWHNVSRVWRAAHPLCAECQRRGEIKAGEVVDHIIPWPICAEFFFDDSNFQTLCQKCNHDKGQKDKVKIQEWKRKNLCSKSK